jgi:hypothetical protein
VELLGATDQVIAVHLRHGEIAEEEVDRSRERVGDGVECVLRIDECDDAVASGFEKESSDGQDLLIVVNAENGLLGAHSFSVLPACILERLQNRVVDTAWRMGSRGAFAGWRARWRGGIYWPAIRADELAAGAGPASLQEALTPKATPFRAKLSCRLREEPVSCPPNE